MFIPSLATIKAGLVSVVLIGGVMYAANAYRDYVRKDFQDEIAALNVNIGKKDMAIQLSEANNAVLRKALGGINGEIAAMEKGYIAALLSVEKDLAAVRVKFKKGEENYARLEAITAPIINLTDMTPAQIAGEIGTCRRAVDINNAYTLQGETL